MIIDTFSGLPDRRVMKSWLMAFTPYKGYVRLFGEKMAPALGTTVEKMLESIQENGPEPVVEQMLDGMAMTFLPLDDYISVMDSLDVQAQGVWVHVTPGDIFSQPAVAAAVEAKTKYPGRFFLLPSFDLSDDLPERVAAFHAHTPIAGVTTLAFIDGVFPDDPKYFPLYQTLDRLGLVLWNHTVNSWSEAHVSEFGHPRYVDKIAVAFPSLKIVMGHGGFPWVNEAMAVVRRQPNVYLEPSSHRWKHLSRPGSGWEPLMYYGNWNASDKILFGSMWQLQALPLATAIKEVKALPLLAETIEKWTYKNARRLYGL